MVDNVITQQAVALPRGDLPRPRGLGYGAQLGDLNLRLAVHPEFPLRYYTRDSLAPRVADQSNVYENTLDIGYTFVRADLTGGAGLDWFPRRNAQTVEGAVTDEVRFWDSRNIDVSRTQFDSEYVLRLHKKIELWQDYTPDAATAIGRSPASFFVGVGLTIEEYTTLSGTPTPVATTITLPGAVDEIWNLGFEMYALLDTGDIWRKQANDTLFTAWVSASGNDSFTNMWTVKGRVVAQKEDGSTGSNVLVEVVDGGAGDVVIDSFTEGVDVQAVVDAGPVVLAAVTDGYLYSYTVNNTDQLEIVSQTELPDGEAPILLAYNQGVVLYLTGDEAPNLNQTLVRGYLAEVLDSRFNFVVGNSQLFFETTSSVDVATTGFTDVLVTRDEIWWGQYESNAHQVDHSMSLYRVDIATKGLNRGNSQDRTGVVDPADLNVFEGRKFWIEDGDVFAESETVFAGASGGNDIAWLIYPNINFGLSTDINWVESVFDVGNLANQGVQAEMYRSGDPSAIFDQTDSAWVLMQRVTSSGTSGNEFAMTNVTSKQLTLQVRLYPHSQLLDSPTVRRVTMRGLPTQRDLMVELPVNISDYIEVPYRMPVHIPGWGDKVYDALMKSIGTHLEALVYEPPLAFRGIVDNIDQPIMYKSDRGSQGRVCMIRLRGSRITATEAPTGDAGAGLGLLGVSILGVGQSEDT